MLKDYSISKLEEIIKKKQVYSHDLVHMLLDDPRQGVQALGRRLQKKMAVHRKKILHLRKLQAFDAEKRERWGSKLVGVDEAGRGPLAGPVVAAAVILPPAGVYLFGIQDSKALNAKERTKAFCIIHKHALAVGVGLATSREIDNKNIHVATLLAMARAVKAINGNIELVLLDGQFKVPDLDQPQVAVTGGDASSLSIAAASIVAKVTRDWFMDILDSCYPLYKFKENKGYGTAKHLQAIEKYGPCPQHRSSFRPINETRTEGGTLFDY